MTPPAKHWAHYTPLIAAFASGLLVVWKGLVWWKSNSLAVQASLVDSALDGVASLINFWAIRMALRPADACHRFGHDKAEALASLGQALLMLGLSGYVIWQTCISIVFGKAELSITEGSLFIMAVSTFVAIGLVVIQTIAVKRVHSLALQTDVLHYRMDAFTNAGVFLTLWLGYVWLDSLVAFILAAYLAKSALYFIREAGRILMDRELDDAVRDRIRSIVLSHSQVRSLNQLRTRSSGHTQFIQLNVVLDRHLQLYEAHTIAHELEAMIQDNDTTVSRDVTIHQEPVE